MTRGVRWDLLQRLAAAALVPLSLGLLMLRCAADPDVPFVRRDAGHWWMAPTEVSALLEQWGREDAPRTTFSGRIEVASPPPGPVVAHVRALRHFAVRIDGRPVDVPDPQDWRTPVSLDLRPWLEAGARPIELEVEVANRRGPGLLGFELEGLPAASLPTWQTAIDGEPLGAAIPADDTRRNPHAFSVESPLEGLVASRDVLLAAFVLGAAALAFAPQVASRLPAGLRGSALPGSALLVASVAWVWLFLAKASRIPPLVGFDAGAHMDYIEFLGEQGRLPLATDGWSMYHPPLFYAISAALEGLGSRALKVVPFVSGLALVFVSHSLATRLHRGEPRVAFLAVAFAACFPMALYSASYLTNESLHAALVGVALLATVDLLQAEKSSWRSAAWVGLWLGVAALTKFTVLAVAPVALFFVALKGLALERQDVRALTGRCAALVGAFLLVAGWFYARNLWHFGTPVVGNWALPGQDQVWWQQPGFHTWSYYLSFGESLRHPYLSGFASFWDGVYSTLWGDGYIAGRVHPHERHGFWSYDYMSAGYLLALPVCALLGLGLVRAVVDALRDPDPGRRAALSFLLTAVYAIGFAFLGLTVSLPFFAQAKAPYALCLTPVLAVAFAGGCAWVDDRLAELPGGAALRSVGAGLLAAALACFFLGFAA